MEKLPFTEDPNAVRAARKTLEDIKASATSSPVEPAAVPVAASQTVAAPARPVTGLQRFNRAITNPEMQKYLGSVLSEKKSSFVNNIVALVANSASLQECEPNSVIFAGVKATALDLPLDPNLGLAYVIPFRNNKAGKTEAQFQIGYKGFVQLAIRSGQFRTINVRGVRDGELVGEDFISGEMRFTARREPMTEGEKYVGYLAFFELTNGFRKMDYWTAEQIETHAKRYSQTYSSRHDYIQKSSKWTTDFDAMAKKTVLKLLLSKYAPLSVEMQQAIVSDQSILGGDNSVRYADNETGVVDASATEIDTTTTDGIRKAVLQGSITAEQGEKLLADLNGNE